AVRGGTQPHRFRPGVPHDAVRSLGNRLRWRGAEFDGHLHAGLRGARRVLVPPHPALRGGGRPAGRTRPRSRRRRRVPSPFVRVLGVPPMDLAIVWFILLAVLWTGYLVLEGFDFGVGMLMPFVAKNDKERRVALNTIGPVWDGNEVWLLTAGGATFAAFPDWYATLLSGVY